MAVPRGMQQEAQSFCCGKKGPRKHWKWRERLIKHVFKVLKSPGIDLHPRLPQLYSLLFFVVVVLFVQTKINTLKICLPVQIYILYVLFLGFGFVSFFKD